MKILLIFSLIIAGTFAATTVNGYKGGSVQFECPYRPEYKNNKKYICKVKCSGWENVPVQSGAPAKDPRFSLHDNTTAGVFTVTITNLKPEDGATYWCAIERTGTDFYRDIRLVVKTNVPASSTVRPSTHTTPSTPSTHTTPSTRATPSTPSTRTTPSTHTTPSTRTTHATRPTDFINSTHTTSTNSTSPSVHAESTCSTTDTPISNASQASQALSSPEFPTSTVIIAVSVVLVLLLIAILFAVARQCKKKTPASSHQSFSKNHVVPLSVCGNETKDTICLPTTIYSNDQFLTKPLAIYSNPGLHTVPFDSPHIVYSTVETHPSKSPDQDVYPTAQLPTIPSDPMVSAAPASAEDSMYAEVSFDTGSLHAAPTVTYNHESNSCVYATVTGPGCG